MNRRMKAVIRFTVLLINAVYGRRHIKYAIRQPDTLTGFLTQDLIKQFEDKVITIPRLQYLKFADIKVSSCGIGLFIEPLDMLSWNGESFGTSEKVSKAAREKVDSDILISTIMSTVINPLFGFIGHLLML